nr:hypothetical protein [Tanacetum cinerariifolium]
MLGKSIDLSSQDQSMKKKADSYLKSMPDDDVSSVSRFEEMSTNDEDILFIPKQVRKARVSGKLSYCEERLDKNDLRTKELVDLMNDMVYFLDSAQVFRKANAEREKDERKGKGIATEENPLKDLIPLMDKLQEMQRLAFLKRRKKSHGRADSLPVTKIRYRINNSTKEASMQIIKDNNPLNLTVYENFVLKMLGFSEWLKVHALASKVTRKSNNVLLKNLKAKFRWVKTQAKNFRVPPPPELSAFGLSIAKMKRKRSLKILKEFFTKEDIMVDGMHRNLVPPSGVVGSRGLTSERYLERLSGGRKMFSKELEIEFRNYVSEARKKYQGLAECKALANSEGLAECKASASNLGHTMTDVKAPPVRSNDKCLPRIRWVQTRYLKFSAKGTKKEVFGMPIPGSLITTDL